MRLIYILIIIMSISIGNADPIKKWVIDYSRDNPSKEFKPYQLLVLDNTSHINLNLFKRKHKILLGYISLGEVENIRSYYDQSKKDGYILDENKNWPGSFYVDVRNPKWTKLVISKVIPSILSQGFDGIFIDTIDNPEYLETSNPKKYKNMQLAAINLLIMIRMNFPHIKIMINRGYSLLPDVAKYIDYVLAESLMTDIRFKDKSYKKRPEKVYLATIKKLRELQDINPKLLLFSLDYWNPKDTEEIKAIYKTERENGFIPYVSTINLNKIYTEPK
jgi:uncharacterized protein (TIGR01370 family)